MLQYYVLALIIHLSRARSKVNSDLVSVGSELGYGTEKWELNGQHFDWNKYQEYRKIEKYDEERIKLLNERFGYTGPTANDGPENLIRPCVLKDWQCIRKFFADNGQCTPAYGPLPDPFILEVNTIYLPCVNLSITFIDYSIKGLGSAKIRDFYVNKKSGNLVISVDTKDINMTSPRAYFRYHRTAKEPIVTSDSSTALFRGITFTVVIPKVPELRLDLAENYYHVEDSIPDFKFGPNAYTSTDPDVIRIYAELSGPLLPACVRESFLLQAHLFTNIFIQNVLCDFGLELSTS